MTAKVPDAVMGEPVTVNPVGTLMATLVTVPVVELVPAPIAVLNVVASKADTVLSALIRGNVIAVGFANV